MLSSSSSGSLLGAAAAAAATAGGAAASNETQTPLHKRLDHRREAHRVLDAAALAHKPSALGPAAVNTTAGAVDLAADVADR